MRRRCYCCKAVAVVAVEYTHKDRNTSVSPYGHGAHGPPGNAVAVGVCYVMPAPGWQKVTFSLPNAILLESGAWVVMHLVVGR